LDNVIGQGGKIGAAAGQLLGALVQLVDFHGSCTKARQLAVGIRIRLDIGLKPAQLAVVAAAPEGGVPGLAGRHGRRARGSHGGAVGFGQGQPGIIQGRGRFGARVFVEVRVGVGDGSTGVEVEDENGHRSRDGPHLLVAAGHFGRQVFGLPAGLHAVGHIHGQAQHTGGLARVVAQGLVRKIDVVLAPHSRGGVYQHQRRFLAVHRFAGVVYLVEHRQKALSQQLRKALGQGGTEAGAVLCHGIIAGVGEGEAVLGALHSGNEGRGLGQNLPELLGTGNGGPQLLGHVQQAHQQVAQLVGGRGKYGL